MARPRRMSSAKENGCVSAEREKRDTAPALGFQKGAARLLGVPATLKDVRPGTRNGAEAAKWCTATSSRQAAAGGHCNRLTGLFFHLFLMIWLSNVINYFKQSC